MKTHFILYFLLFSNVLIYSQEFYYNKFPIRNFNSSLPIDNYKNQDYIRRKKIKKIIELREGYYSLKDTVEINYFDKNGEKYESKKYERNIINSITTYSRKDNIVDIIVKDYNNGIFHFPNLYEFHNVYDKINKTLIKNIKSKTLGIEDSENKYTYDKNLKLIKIERFTQNEFSSSNEYQYINGLLVVQTNKRMEEKVLPNSYKSNKELKIIDEIIYKYDENKRVIQILKNPNHGIPEEYNFIYDDKGNLYEESNFLYSFNADNIKVGKPVKYIINSKINYFYNIDKIYKITESNTENDKIESEIYYNKEGNLEKIISKILSGKSFKYFSVYRPCSILTYEYTYNDKNDLIKLSIKEDGVENKFFEYIIEYYD